MTALPACKTRSVSTITGNRESAPRNCAASLQPSRVKIKPIAAASGSEPVDPVGSEAAAMTAPRGLSSLMPSGR
jgi:hypothetical protein